MSSGDKEDRPENIHKDDIYTGLLLVNLEKSGFSQKLFFLVIQVEIGGGLGVSGRSAQTIRNFSLELSQDMVLHGIRKSTFRWRLDDGDLTMQTMFVSDSSFFVPGTLDPIF